MMQSDEDAQRIAAIGAPRDKIQVTGNIKFDRSLVEEAAVGNDRSDLETAFLADGTGAPLIVAGSTHPGEEEILLEALRKVRGIPELSKTRLLLAPRHPERFGEVADIVARSGFKMSRRTAAASTQTCSDILLLDTLGELAAAYRFAMIAFVGGTLVSRGGHSIMEPALYSKAIVTGPSMENFRAVADEFSKNNGIRQIQARQEDRDRQVEQLSQAFIHLLMDANARETLGKNAFSILDRNRGAARISADQIISIFEESKGWQKDLETQAGN
jgi:3-deoxy-D-manno-octulosonic-acid transferase